MTPTDTVSACLQTIKAIRDTIEKALVGRHVRCKAAGDLNGHECQIVGVHVDCYTGVAVQLVSLQGDTVNFLHPKTTWVQATETELPPTPWETGSRCTCPIIEGATRNSHDHNWQCPLHPLNFFDSGDRYRK